MSKLKIISWNVNGLRTRFKNKQLEPLFAENPDILLFQETKAKYDQLDDKLKKINDYTSYFSPGETSRSGGIATFSKIKPLFIKKFFKENDASLKGRVLNFDFDGFKLIHIYAPTGAGLKTNFKLKLDFYKNLLKYIETISSEKVIIAGDFNIAHNEKDISNPEDASQSTNFLSEERELMDKIESFGFKDSYRLLHSDEEKYSSWKSTKAKKTDEGARLDYFFVSESLVESIEESNILSDIEGSKHAPIELVINI